MTTTGARVLRFAMPLAALSLALAGCGGGGGFGGGYFGGGDEPPPPPPPQASAPPPPNMNVGDFVGRWGLAAYHKEGDRARTEVQARGQCSNAYVIGRGPTGGVMMHLADNAQPQELRLKLGSDGRIYLGPEGPAPDRTDREVVGFDGRILLLRYTDPEIGNRYGTSVYVRCGAPGTAAKKKTS